MVKQFQFHPSNSIRLFISKVNTNRLGIPFSIWYYLARDENVMCQINTSSTFTTEILVLMELKTSFIHEFYKISNDVKSVETSEYKVNSLTF